MKQRLPLFIKCISILLLSGFIFLLKYTLTPRTNPEMMKQAIIMNHVDSNKVIQSHSLQNRVNIAQKPSASKQVVKDLRELKESEKNTDSDAIVYVDSKNQDEGTYEDKLTKQNMPEFQATRYVDECDSCFQHNFDYIIESDSVCNLYTETQTIDLIIVIFSRLPSTSQRHRIRNSWAKATLNNTSNIRHIFILGTNFVDRYNKAIYRENQVRRDIIQENFSDTYHNLTLKITMALKWVSERCFHAKYFLKTDDDVWLNIPHIMDIIGNEKEFLKNGLGGDCHLKSKPIRDPDSKFYLTEKEYPYAYFPPYCSGAAYITSVTTAIRMSNVFQNIPPLYWEDVYVGMLMWNLHLKVRNLDEFWIDEDINQSCHLRDYITVGHGYLSEFTASYMAKLCPNTYLQFTYKT